MTVHRFLSVGNVQDVADAVSSFGKLDASRDTASRRAVFFSWRMGRTVTRYSIMSWGHLHLFVSIHGTFTFSIRTASLCTYMIN